MPAALPDVPVLHPLQDRLEDDFSLQALEAAARALADHDNPLRLNFFCAAMRILFEHSMDQLSPADQVKNCPWFTAELENGQPTRAQRVKYAVQGGLADDFVVGELKINVKPLQRSLNGTIGELGKHIHARERTVVRDLGEQDVLSLEIIACALAYFDAAAAARAAIMDPIREALDDAAVERDPAHINDGRRDPAALRATLAARAELLENTPPQVILLDDVLTTGCSFKVCKAMLLKAWPGTKVYGLFVARRVIDHSASFADVIDVEF